MNKPTLTVAMPNYNHARYLPAALDAILSQSRMPDEFIVIDDASTDNSVDILKEYSARYPSIRLILNEKNQGAAAGLIRLLDLSTSDYFYAPAADDMIKPGFLEKSLQILSQFPEAGLCSTLSEIVDEDGRSCGMLSGNPFRNKRTAHYMSVQEVRSELYKRGSWMQGNTVMFRREALIQSGKYQTDLGPYADGFAHEVIALTYGACFVPEPLAIWRRIPTALSARTLSNPAAIRKMRDAAHGYMVGKYKNLFSDRYVVRWQKRWDGAFLIAYARAKRSEYDSGLRQILSRQDVSSRFIRSIGNTALVIALGLVILMAAILRWFDIKRFVRKKMSGQTGVVPD